MPLRVEWAGDAEGFAALAEEWDALLPVDAHPFDLHCWYLAWWEAFGASSEMAVCTVRRDGRLAAAFPLRREGSRLLGFANDHSPLCRPLATDREAMEALVSAVAESARGLELRGLPAGDPSVAQLEAAAREASMLPLLEPAYASPFVDTSGDYETWRKENKHRWKAPLERLRRKMGRDYDAQFTFIEPPRDFERELEEGLRIEASGWKGEEGTAINSTPETAAFYRDVARSFLARDELRFNWIVLDGIAVSFDLCLLYRNRLYTVKNGFDESYRRLAPGLVLRLGVIERCFETEVDEHDLLGDEIGWKTRFASDNRPHLNLRTYPGGSIGHLRHRYRTRLRPRLKTAYGRLRPVQR